MMDLENMLLSPPQAHKQIKAAIVLSPNVSYVFVCPLWGRSLGVGCARAEAARF